MLEKITKSVFPGKEWESRSPEELGFSTDKLASVEVWLREMANGASFRVVIARYGYMAAEWGQGIDIDVKRNQSSSTKSYYSCILGIVVSQNPGIWGSAKDEAEKVSIQNAILTRILDAVKEQ